MRSAFLLAITLAAAALQAQAEPTAYERLLSILEPGAGRTPPANIEQVLEALPENLRSNFTLVHSSRSAHRDAIDPLFPRVILFTEDGKLLLAFTGNPDRPGYNQLEAIHFDDRTSSFRTSSFTLGERASQNGKLGGKIDQFECTRCHGGDVRPIFDSYSLWPGFYGSLADNLGRDTRERRDYLRFLAENAGRGVYRHLRFPAGSATTPYDDGSKQLTTAEALRLHPNERLGDALTPLNWKRIVRKLAAQGDVYRRLRYPLLAGMLGCSGMPISTAFDESIRAALQAENARRFERAGLDAEGTDGSYRFRMQELVQDIPQGIAEIAYAARALGVRRTDWSMSFEPSSLGFFDGVLTPEVLYIKEDFVTAMLGELASTDPEFARHYNPSFVFSDLGFRLGFKLPMAAVYGNRDLCALLGARTKAAGAVLETVESIDARERRELPRTPRPPIAVLTRCAACHEGNTRAFAGVEIPFTDPLALRHKLRSERSLTNGGPLLQEMLTRISAGARNAMPPGVPLSERDRRQLGDYLIGLERSTAAPRR